MKQHIDQRKTISAPITITIASSCPSSSGNATVTIKNTSAAAVSGTLQFAVKERGIKHAWQGMSYVENAVRSMIPNDKGEAVSISPGQTVTKTRAFTIGSGWVKDSCRLVAFVQKSDKEVVEACVSGVNVGTPVTTDKSSPVETIGIRQTKEAVMLYVPCKEKYTVSLMDVRGKTVATSTVEGNGGWLQLPRLTMHGIILIRIDMSGKRYVTRTFAGL